MKVIDIFNKIAKGEEVPVFTISDDRYKYFLENGYLYQQKYDEEQECVDWQIYSDWLNREIEIIEEHKNIEKLDKDKYKYSGTEIDEVLIDKINELIDEVNKLKED